MRIRKISIRDIIILYADGPSYIFLSPLHPDGYGFDITYSHRRLTGILMVLVGSFGQAYRAKWKAVRDENSIRNRMEMSIINEGIFLIHWDI